MAQLRQHTPYHWVKQMVILLPSGVLLPAESYDISEGGVSLLCANSVPVATACRLGYTLSDASGVHTFACSAIVRHVVFACDGGFRLGLQFTSMPASSRRMLLALLERLALQASEFGICEAADVAGAPASPS